MSRYINVDKLSRDVIASWDKDQHHTLEASRVHRQEHHHLMSIIEKQPTADVVEVRHGEWAFEVKHFFDDYGDLNVYAKGWCSECGKDYPFNPTIATEYIERPDNLIGYAAWDIDVEPIKTQVAHKARNNKDLYPFCPNCGAKMDGERREE